jgi:hypothetical protein
MEDGARTVAAPDDRPSRRRGGRGRRVGAKVLLVLGCVVLLVANVVVWARLTALDTDRFVAAVGPLSSDRELTDALAVELTDRILEQVDVRQRVEAALSDDNPLVVSIASRLARTLVEDALRTVMASEQFDRVWTTAVREAHERALQVIDGADGSVAIRVTDVLQDADDVLSDRGLDVIDSTTIQRIDDIVVTSSERLQQVQQGVSTLRTLAVVLPVATVVLLGVAVLLAVDRRHMLALVGVGVAVTMVVTFVALRIGRRVLSEQIEDATARMAAGDVWTNALTPLFRLTAALLALGLLLALGAWLLGPAPVPVRVRGWIAARRGGEGAEALPPAPALVALGAHRRQVQAGLCVVGAVLLLLLPSLTVGSALLILALVVLAVVAVEALSPPSTATGTSGSGRGPTVPRAPTGRPEPGPA